ncbi:MAG: (E)-4-hydroxy-3-methylbut-2-enyl-diphosphate synthase [Bacteroidia bacterium]|nr:(E)-4-hydroxy-3-methylbut-2-enyl-diphosphate synthase [Bacteroidia bacterium]
MKCKKKIGKNSYIVTNIQDQKMFDTSVTGPDKAGISPENSQFRSSEVMIGNVPLGAGNPIRIQSMTNTLTSDISGTVEQAIRIFDAGADYVRITVPTVKDARTLEIIRNELHLRGYTKPLIADVHFNPEIAEVAACFVEKVRINPGNYSDKKNTEQDRFTEDKYYSDLKTIREKLFRLIAICREHNTALRIGTNHGSLSDRIVSRYGDTPAGMVEATMEFLRICRDEQFHHVVVSLKSSNVRVMVNANRLMVKRMMDEGMNYPLHLGVTEAGEGEDGRIKSAVGIGALLTDNIGDTIRISLTEAPEDEIPVARILVEMYPRNYQKLNDFPVYDLSFGFERRKTLAVRNIGDAYPPVVIADFSNEKAFTPQQLEDAGYQYDEQYHKWNKTNLAADFIYTGDTIPGKPITGITGFICNYQVWSLLHTDYENVFPVFDLHEFLSIKQKSLVLNFVRIEFTELTDDVIKKIKSDLSVVLITGNSGHFSTSGTRSFFRKLAVADCKTPVFLRWSYNSSGLTDFQLRSSSDTGTFFIDGMADGIWLYSENPSISKQNINSTAFSILQACRTRITRTEFISCPSCGRTLFDIQKVTTRIRNKTAHLKNLKIAVMGCIVNGPGEMADADYGYVGAGPGKITLYKGKEIMKKNVPEETAVDELLALINKFT